MQQTSLEAYESIKPYLNRMQKIVLDHIKSSPDGATDQEIEIATGFGVNSVHPRRIELIEKGLIKDSGKRRLTRSGRNAIVWELTNESGNEDRSN